MAKPLKRSVGCWFKHMKGYRCQCLLLFALLTTCAAVSAPQKPDNSVPDGFAYPDIPQSSEFVKPFFCRSLSGKIQIHPLRAGGANIPIERALVERMSADWSTRLEAKFTNSNGDFAFSQSLRGSQYVKVSKPGYATVKLKVIVTKRAAGKLDVPMSVCCVLN